MRKDRIAMVLTEALSPTLLEVVDESDKHAGHAGARPGGETHYRVRIVAEAFQGRSRVEAHRMVTDALKAEFDTGLHALAVDTRAPMD